MKKTPQFGQKNRQVSRTPYLSCILLGLILRQFRVQQSLTQENVAERAGCHASYLSTIENGKAQFSIKTFEELCKALHLSPADLYSLAQALEAHYLNSDLVRSGQGKPNNPLTAQRWLDEYIRRGHLRPCCERPCYNEGY